MHRRKSRLTEFTALAWLLLVVLNYLVRAVLPELHPLSLLAEAQRLAAWDWAASPARLFANARALVTAGLIPLAATGLGGPTLAWMIGRPNVSLPLAIAAGLGGFGTGLLGLGYLGLLRGPVLVGVILLAGTAGALRLARLRPPAALGPASPGRRAVAHVPRPAALRLLRWLAAASILGWTLCALPPETEMDSLKYHLGKPQQYLLHGKIVTNLSVFFKFPSLWEALLAAPMGLDGPAAAKAVQPVVVLLIAALLLVAMGPAAPFGGQVAAGLLVTSYGIGRLAVTAKNDVLVACFALAAFTAWRSSPRGRHRGWMLVAGLFLGFAVSTKYTALLAVAMLLAVGTATRWGRATLGSCLREGVWAGGGLLLGYAPWGLKLWLETGNPVYPFAADIFHAGMYPPSYTLLYIETHRYVSASYVTLADKWRAIWNLSVQEHLWIVPALALPALAPLLRRRSAGLPWMVGGCAAIVVWTIGPPQVRYLLQGITLLCGAIEWSAAAWLTTARGRTVFLRLVLVVAALETARGWGDYWSDRGARLPVALGLLAPETYLQDKLTTYADATRWIEHHTPPAAHVLIFGPTRTFPLARWSTLRTDYEPVPPLAMAADSLDDAHFGRKMRQAGYTHLLYDRLNGVAWGEQLAVILPPDRALIRWAAWWRRHAVQVYESPVFDLRQGAFAVFDLRRAPASPRPPLVLPGVEGWLFPPTALLATGQPREARAWMDRVKTMAGDVALVRQAEVAIFESMLPRRTARRMLKDVDARGLRSVWLYTTLARYAAQAGDTAEAARYRFRAEALSFMQDAAPEAAPRPFGLKDTRTTGGHP